MTYPKFKDKYLEEALVNPEDYIKYKSFPKNLPKKYILIYSSKALDYFKRKYKPKKIILYSLLTVYMYKEIGFVRVTGIGSPNATTILEELIALGGKTFVNIGMAGGLHHEGIFLCTKALRDEGTSYHYLPKGNFTYPDERLTENLGKFIEKEGLEFFSGTTWTTDAPYRETKAEVEKYSKRGIVTVEMEASALFAVAQFRKVKIASVFIVSDLLEKKWTPKFDKINVRKTLNKLVDIGVNCLMGD